MLPYGTLRQRESQRNNCATMVLLPQQLLQAPPSIPYTLHPTMASLQIVRRLHRLLGCSTISPPTNHVLVGPVQCVLASGVAPLPSWPVSHLLLLPPTPRRYHVLLEERLGFPTVSLAAST